jgi:hypothetical protein
LAKKKIPNLIVEFASDSGNLHFLSVIEHRRQNYLAIVDNISSEEVGAYVLDYAQQEKLDVRQLLSAATLWFYRGSTRYPLSFEFSRLGLTPATNRIYKTFELPHVTRLIGNDFRFDFETPPKIRRRRANLIPAGTEIRLRRNASDRQALESLKEAIADSGEPVQLSQRLEKPTL